MAVTGKSAIPVVPGVRKVSPLVTGAPEASAQTNPRGAIAVMTAGFVASAATGCPTSIYGFFADVGQNLATDGAANGGFYRADSGEEKAFVAVLDGVWSSSFRNATAALSMNTAGVVVLKTGTAVSASSNVRMQEVKYGFTVGDTNPIVSFVVLAAAVQV